MLLAAEPFRAALASDCAQGGAVLCFVASKLRRRLRAAKSFRLRSSGERVAAYLRDLIHVKSGPAEVTLSVDKSEIASHLAMTPKTLSRRLARLSEHGVRTDGRRMGIAEVTTFQARSRSIHSSTAPTVG